MSDVSVSYWWAEVKARVPESLRARLRLGASPRLSPMIPEFLWRRPESHGFRGRGWPRAPVAKVLAWEFGLRHHKGHVGRLLEHLGWTLQKSIRRAIQRDEDTIWRWRERAWPELRRGACRERRAVVVVDELGSYMFPGVVRTYAPDGLTAEHREKQTRHHLSVMGGMAPEGWVYTEIWPESLNGLHCVDFLLH